MMNNSQDASWDNKVKLFCDKYDIPLEYLSDIIKDPKVIPMLRGKAFEYSALIRLSDILDEQKWFVSKVPMNAQYEHHDEDITITHLATNKKIRIECKLAKKQSYSSKGGSKIQVKCMRSRTLGDERIKDLAPKIGVTEAMLKIHNDQYISDNFDFVITSIGNAFYRTDKSTGLYEWMPKEDEIKFLQELAKNTGEKLNSPEEQRRFAFRKIYIAKSTDLAVTINNGIICSRKKCTNNTDCHFIPNYPIIKFDLETYQPYKPWYEIEFSTTLFQEFIEDI